MSNIKNSEGLKEKMDPPPYFHSQTLPRTGGGTPKKNPYWIPSTLRTLPGTNASHTSSECESDDSGRSSSSSSNASKGTRRNGELGPVRINYNYNQTIGYHHHMGGNFNTNTLPYNSLAFHNKRRYDGSRAPHYLLRLPTVSLPYHHQIAPDRFLSKSHLIEVRDTPTTLKNGSRWDQLSEEVWNKFMMSQQTEETFQHKMALWKYLYITIKNTYPQYSLYLVGSTVTGFGSNNSDMDLCLVVRAQETRTDRFQALSHLDTVLRFIRSMDAFTSTELIRAKVPILKFRDSCYNLEIDLNCNNTVGIRNTHLIYSYAQLDWRVRPLVVIVKLWAQKHGINDPKNKTISSYSLVLMVIHYLQHGTHPCVLPNLQHMFPEKYRSDQDIHIIDIFRDIPTYASSNKQTLGELLLGFLQYYAKFQYETSTISVRTGGCISVVKSRAQNLNQMHEWKFLCIEEPFDLSNTARSVYDYYAFHKVLRVIRESAALLEKEMTITSLLPP